MAQYINKDKIEEILRSLWKKDDGGNSEHRICYNKALQDVQCQLDTLEVKEVNLEKEAELIANGIMVGVQANRYNTVVYNTKRNDFNHSHLMLAAKKGIELGLKAQKGE